MYLLRFSIRDDGEMRFSVSKEDREALEAFQELRNEEGYFC